MRPPPCAREPRSLPVSRCQSRASLPAVSTVLTHLQRLEAESIYILREVVAECRKPVMLYSLGKDSAVMLHLARKAFPSGHAAVSPCCMSTRPGSFSDMYTYREHVARDSGMELLVYVNAEGVRLGINPFTHGSQVHTDVMKTQALKAALDHYRFDAAFGGARRDEESSRAKEGAYFPSAQRSIAGIRKISVRTLESLQRRRSAPTRAFACFRSNWGRNWTCGSTSSSRTFPIVPLYFAAAPAGRAPRWCADHGGR